MLWTGRTGYRYTAENGKKEGYLAIEGTEEISGSVPINYDRKRISFYNRDFAALCKEMIRKYGGGKFSKGIFFTVKGKKTSDGAVEFDFRDVMYREVTSYKGSKKKAATGKYASDKKNAHPESEMRPLVFDLQLYGFPAHGELVSCRAVD